MVLFNYSTKELTSKVVYYGAGLCGKTTNLQWIHEKLPIKNKGKMVSLATEADRTLFFDFLPIELGTIRGMKTRVQLYTVPGQVFYNATRRMVLKGADCVVFVADSQEAMLDPNLDALANLRENLEANEIDPDEIPIVLQYNKRDLPNALPLNVLNQKLNPKGWLFFEASAKTGVGVEETLKGVTGLVFRSLATKYGGAEGAAKPAPKPTAPPAAPAPKLPPPPPQSPFARPTAPPPRPAPPPPPPPPPPAPHASTPLGGGSADDLLDSLDLGPPEPAGEELSLGEDVGLGIDVTAPVMPAPPPAHEPEMLSELSFDDPGPLEAPGPDPITEPHRTRPPASAMELDLEDLGAEPAPEPSLPELSPISLSGLVPTPQPATRTVAESLPFAEPEPVRSAPAPREAAAEVPVSVAVAPGQKDVVLPIEIAIPAGTTHVTLTLRLTVDLKTK
jgi:signal recognition particle receptor subunit beta